MAEFGAGEGHDLVVAHQENQAQRAAWRQWKEPWEEILPKGTWVVAPVPGGEGTGAHSHSLRRGAQPPFQPSAVV